MQFALIKKRICVERPKVETARKKYFRVYPYRGQTFFRWSTENPVYVVFQHVKISSAFLSELSKGSNFLQESFFIAFDFIWKVLFSDRNFATLLDPLECVLYENVYLKGGRKFCAWTRVPRLLQVNLYSCQLR